MFLADNVAFRRWKHFWNRSRSFIIFIQVYIMRYTTAARSLREMRPRNFPARSVAGTHCILLTQ